MATQLEILLKAKNETDAAFNAVIKNFKGASEESQKAAKSFASTTEKAAKFSDAIGKTATTLARSAGVLNLPVEALRALDDASDVASLGLENLSKSAAGFNAASIGVVGAGLAIGTTIGGWLRDIPAVAAAADRAAEALFKMFGAAGPSAQQAAAATAQWNEEQKKIFASYEEHLRKVTSGMSAEEIKKHFFPDPPKDLPHQLAEEAKAREEASKKAEEAAKRRAEALKREAEAIKQLGDRYKDVGAQAAMDKLAAGIKDLSEVSDAMMGQLVSDVQALVDKGAELPPVFEPLAGMFEQAGPPLSDIQGKVEKLLISTSTLKPLLHDAFFNSVPGVKEITGLVGTGTIKTMDWSKTLQDLSNGFQLLGGTAGKTLSQIAGGIASVMTNIKTIQAANKEGGIAGLLGKITGGLGIAGTVIGVGKGLFDALFGGAKKAREEMEKLKASFVSSQGGMQALAAKAREAGVSLDAMFQAKNSKTLQAAITAIQGQLDGWTESQEKLQAAMDKYGLTVDQMGPRFAQQQLDKQAADLLQSYNLLTAAGAENDLVLQKMSTDMNGYIQTSLKAGTAVPEAMRPMIERMIQMGLLTDEAGNAFGSVEDAGIKFTETLTEGLGRAIDAINRLVAALTQGLNIPPINIPVTGGVGGNGGVHTSPGGHYGGGFPEFAGGGYISRPTLGLVGEAGPEFIFPEAKLSKMLAAAVAAGAAMNGGSSRPIHIRNEISGRPLNQYVTQEMGGRRIRTPPDRRR